MDQAAYNQAKAILGMRLVDISDEGMKGTSFKVKALAILVDTGYMHACWTRRSMMMRDLKHLNLCVAQFDYDGEAEFLTYFIEIHQIWYKHMNELVELYLKVPRAAGVDLSVMANHNKMIFCQYNRGSKWDQHSLFRHLMKDLWESALMAVEELGGVMMKVLSEDTVSWHSYEQALGCLGVSACHSGKTFFEVWIGRNKEVAEEVLDLARECGCEDMETIVTFRVESSPEAASPIMDDAFHGNFNDDPGGEEGVSD